MNLQQDLKTVLYEEHLGLGAKMVSFGGWQMPVQYRRGILVEHEHTRSKVSLFDTCHMGEIFISGPGTANFLDTVVSNRPSSLVVGKCRYGLLLNEHGGIVDDVIVYRLAEDRFMTVVNSATCAGAGYLRMWRARLRIAVGNSKAAVCGLRLKT